MKKATIFFKLLVMPLFIFCQPNKGIDSATMRDGKTLLNWKNGISTVRGQVAFPQSSSTTSLSYLSQSQTYLSQTSGTGAVNFGFWNIAIGDNALDSANGANFNICLGKDAGRSITTANDNFYAGWDAGYHTKTGNENIGIVEDALFSNISGRDNIALGRGAQYSHQYPQNNINIGYNTSYYQEEGVENTNVGAYAGGFIKRGSGNTSIGAYAGEVNDTSKTVNYSTFLGFSSGISSPYSYSISLGANTDVTGDHRLNIGNTIYGENIGSNAAKITIKGSLEVTTGNIIFNGVHYSLPSFYPSGQSVLVNDGFGNLSWQPYNQTTFKPLAVVDPYGRLIGYTQPLK